MVLFAWNPMRAWGTLYIAYISICRMSCHVALFHRFLASTFLVRSSIPSHCAMRGPRWGPRTRISTARHSAKIAARRDRNPSCEANLKMRRESCLRYLRINYWSHLARIRFETEMSFQSQYGDTMFKTMCSFESPRCCIKLPWTWNEEPSLHTNCKGRQSRSLCTSEATTLRHFWFFKTYFSHLKYFWFEVGFPTGFPNHGPNVCPNVCLMFVNDWNDCHVSKKSNSSTVPPGDAEDVPESAHVSVWRVCWIQKCRS